MDYSKQEKEKIVESFLYPGSQSDFSSRPSGRRNKNSIRQAMLATAGASSPLKAANNEAADPSKLPGLTLKQLENDRWNVSAKVARARIESVGLPYEGRRANIIYSWSSIFRAEGLAESTISNASPHEFPDLYRDLLSTSAAADYFGYKDASSIRKILLSGKISPENFIVFGTRGIYRIRPAALFQMKNNFLTGRIV